MGTLNGSFMVRRRGRFFWRWYAILLVVGLIGAVSLAPGLATRAAAALRNPIPTNDLMEPTYDFFTNENLYLYSTSDIQGGTACIVAETMTTPTGNCEAKAWGTPNRIVGIGSTHTLIEGAYLRPGRWRILTTDSQMAPIAVSEAFTVQACTPDMNCDRSIALAEANKYKDSIRPLATGVTATCLAFNLKDKYENLPKGLGNARTVKRTTQIPETNWPATAMSVVSMLGGALGFSFPDFSNPGEEKALEILHELTCNVQKMYADIIADPPDPNFGTVAQPVFMTMLPSGSAQTDALAKTLDRQRAFGRAMLTAYERYQGAVAAADVAGQLRQLDAIVAFSDQLDHEVRVTAATLRVWSSYATGVVGLKEAILATQAIKDASIAAYQRVRVQGFTATELATLDAAGWNTAELHQRARDAFAGDPSLIPLGWTLAQQADALAGDLENSLDGLRSWSDYVAAVAGQLRVPVNQSPTARFSVSPTGGGVPLTVTVDARTSSDPDGSIADYAWDFGDGTAGSGPVVQHTYTGVGTATIQLTVKDDKGATNRATQRVTITTPLPNEAPVAAFSATPSSGQAPMTVALDATGSSDADGRIVSFAWDFGDGSGPALGQTVTHQFAASGTFSIRLVVTDDKDATASVTHSVTVAPAPIDAPVAQATASPTDGTAPLSVNFTNTSWDPGGRPLTYYWSFGDGTSSTEANPGHVFTTPGVYGVALTVTNDAGVAASTIVMVRISVLPNMAPVASFVATPTEGETPLTVSVDASGSFDSDGTVVSYEWLLAAGVTASGVTASTVFQTPGTYTVQLRVTDDRGAQALASATVTVTQSTQAVDDWLYAQGATAIDVLANDLAADRSALRVVSSSAPSHGVVTCEPGGGCLYVPVAGYVGADLFTYAIRDAMGRERTAQVIVTVTATPNHAGVASAVTDHAFTRVGQPVALAVLGNDDGSAPLRVTSTTQPRHGSLACSAITCLYTPESGFSGYDGFTYRLVDATGAEATGSADVRVVAVPVGPLAPQVSATGSPQPAAAARNFALAAGVPSVVEGSDATWQVGLAGLGAGVPIEAVSLVGMPSGTVKLSGRHLLSASVTAHGWRAETSPDARSLGVQPTDPIVGDRLEQAIPAPLPPISQGTGGDGHVPILVGSRVFAFFHHSNPTSVSCVDRATGMLCPGYPMPVGFASSSINGPGVVVGSRIYTHLYTAADSTAVGLFCWDTDLEQSCGYTVLERVQPTAASGASAPVSVHGLVWVASPSGHLLCFDPTTRTECAAQFIGTPNSFGGIDILGYGTRVYVRQGADLICRDVAAGTPCAGWAGAQSIEGPLDIVAFRDSVGVPIGVCIVAPSESTCVPDIDPAERVKVSGIQTGDGYHNITTEAVVGPRVFRGSLGEAGLACFDWSTRAPCVGPQFDQGWARTDLAGTSLPSAYGTAFDGACVVALGDPGQVFTVAPDGSSPCTSLDSGVAARSVDLRDQRCDGGVGMATWREVTLLDEEHGAGLTSIRVTVRDAQSGAVVAEGDLAKTPRLDLSGVDPAAHPALSVSAVVTSAPGNPAWADGVAPRLVLSWVADPLLACLTSRIAVDCTASLGDVGIRASFGEPAQSAELSLNLVRSQECTAPTTTSTPTTSSTTIATSAAASSSSSPPTTTSSSTSSSGAVRGIPTSGAVETTTRRGADLPHTGAAPGLTLAGGLAVVAIAVGFGLLLWMSRRRI